LGHFAAVPAFCRLADGRHWAEWSVHRNRETQPTPPMFDKIKSLAKQPSTYVLIFLGAVLALSVPFIRNLAAPIASKIPGAK